MLHFHVPCKNAFKRGSGMRTLYIAMIALKCVPAQVCALNMLNRGVCTLFLACDNARVCVPPG